MHGSTKRFIAILLSLAGFFYAAFTVLNVLAPAWSRLETLRIDIAEREAARDRVSALVEKAREFLAQSEELERRARPIYASLPVTPELPELVAILSAISSKNRVVFSQARFEIEGTTADSAAAAAPGLPSVSKVKVAANIVGRYADLENWFKDAEAELRLLDVRALSLQIVGGQAAVGPDSQISAEVLMQAYWQHPITPTQ